MLLGFLWGLRRSLRLPVAHLLLSQWEASLSRVVVLFSTDAPEVTVALHRLLRSPCGAATDQIDVLDDHRPGWS